MHYRKKRGKRRGFQHVEMCPVVLYSEAKKKNQKKNRYPGNSSLLRQLFMYSLFWQGMKEVVVFFVFKVLLHMHFNARKEKGNYIKKKKKRHLIKHFKADTIHTIHHKYSKADSTPLRTQHSSRPVRGGGYAKTHTPPPGRPIGLILFCYQAHSVSTTVRSSSSAAGLA